MHIHGLLGLSDIENIYFVEVSFASLKNISLSLHYLKTIQLEQEPHIRGIRDEIGEIIGLVIYNPGTEESPDFHAIFTNLIASEPAPNESSRIFSSIVKNLKIQESYAVTRKEFKHAIMEYYSNSLVNRKLCENCHIKKEPYDMVYIKSRNSKLKGILNKFELEGELLEICCGNGMSTLPLHEMGYDPLCIDNDKCQICQGLEHNVLRPDSTIVLDATNLSQFFPENSFDAVVGFMLGTIYRFNQGLWEKIISESVRVLRTGGTIMLTVNKKEEMEILRDALESNHISGKMFDNTDDKGIYDQWVYVGTKQAR